MLHLSRSQALEKLQGSVIPILYGTGVLPFTGDAFLTMSLVHGVPLSHLCFPSTTSLDRTTPKVCCCPALPFLLMLLSCYPFLADVVAC